MVIDPIVGVYIPIIRIPIKGGMTIPNITRLLTMAHVKFPRECLYHDFVLMPVLGSSRWLPRESLAIQGACESDL